MNVCSSAKNPNSKPKINLDTYIKTKPTKTYITYNYLFI